MTIPWLEVRYRRGAIFAAYLHLAEGSSIAASHPCGPGLVMDVDAQGRAVGLEIISPPSANRDDLQRAMDRFHVLGVEWADFTPILAGPSSLVGCSSQPLPNPPQTPIT